LITDTTSINLFNSIPKPAGQSRDNPLDSLQAVDAVFDLSRSSGDPLRSIANLDPEALDEFITMTVRLLKAGIVGTETYDRDGRPYTTFITTGMADPELRGLPYYRDRFDTERLLNARA
jgi:hypothetical protein